MILIVFFLAGILRVSAAHLQSPQHVRFIENGKGTLQGKVATLPETTIKGKRRMARFLLESENWRPRSGLKQTEGDVQVFIFYPPNNICYGDTIRIHGELMAPKRATNRDEFNYAKFLTHQGIYKVFQSFGEKSVRFVSGHDDSWRSRIEEIRTFIQNRIEILFPFPDREIVEALWLGLRRNIPEEINNIFVRTGTIHLLSISGLHITLVGGFFYFLFRQLQTPRKINAVLSILVISFYVLIAGAMPPVLRAGIMGVLILCGILLEQDTDSWNILVVAFFLFMAANPNALFLVSFQLSFLSMAILILFSRTTRQESPDAGVRTKTPIQWKEKLLNSFADTIRTSFLIVSLMLPVFAFYFHLSSLAGIVSNMIAIPMSFWIMIASLLAFCASFLPLAATGLLVWITSRLFQALLFILSWFSKIPFSNWHLPNPPVLFSIGYYAVLGFFYWHPSLRRIKKFGIASVVLLFLLFLSSSVSSSITFFETGHSDSILLRFSKNRQLLINSGRRLSDSRLNWVIEPSLLSSGARKVWVLFGDSKKNLGRERMKSLEQGFELMNFDPKLFPEVELFWLQSGKLGACLVKSPGKDMLAIFRFEKSLIERLLNAKIKHLDALYLAAGRMDEVAPLLSKIRTQHIIFNDQKYLSEFLSQTHGLGRSVLHFLSEGGSVTWKGLSAIALSLHIDSLSEQ